MSTDTDKSLLLQPVSKWSFDFWRRQVEGAIDIPSAIGRLNACGSLDQSKYGDSLILYLMDIGKVERRSSYHSESTREEVLSIEACRCLSRHLTIRFSGLSEMRYVPLTIVEKSLWFFEPVEFMGKRIDPFSGPGDISKSLRRFRMQLCWALWKGENGSATREHKGKVLQIFYSINRLFELAPSPGYEHHLWDDFEDVLPDIETLAQVELEELGRSYRVQSIEEAAYWNAPACRLLLLVRPILIGRTEWIRRNDATYKGHRVNLSA